MKEKWNFEKEKIERKNRKKTLTWNIYVGQKIELFIIYNNNIYIILFLQYFFVFYITNITQYIVDDKFLC